MQPIIPTIRPGESDAQVTNLQDALFALLEAKIFRPVTAPNRPTQEEIQALTENLKQERERSLFGKATQQLIMYFQVQQGVGDTLGGVVEEKTADLLNRLLTKLGFLDETPSNEFTVKGMITQPNGKPVAGLVVRAFDRDLRRFGQLGKDTVAGADGHYEIPYSSNEFSRAEKGSADLVIRVYSADAAKDTDEPLVESATLYNAPAVAEINLPLPDTGIKLSEVENHVVAITPLLSGQVPDGSDLQIAALTDADIGFIVGETNIDRQHIAWLIQAAGFEEKSKTVDPTILTHVVYRFVPAAAFYAWFRQGLTTDWEVLISQSASLLKRALLAAVKENVVPKSLEDQADQIVERLPSVHRRNLTELGVVSGLTPSVMTQLTRRLDNIDRVGDNVLSRLVKENVLTDQDARAFGLGVSLQRLTGFDTHSVAALRELLPKDGETAVHKAPDLVRLDFPEWSRLLHGAQPGGVLDDPSIPMLARKLEADIAEAFPKAAFEFRLTRLPAGIDQHIERLQPVLAGNGHNGSESDAPALSDARNVLTRLANLHPGLALLENIRKAESPAHATSAITERIGWMRKVFDVNPGVDFLSVDLTPDSTDLANIRFDGLADDAKGMVLNNLKTHQRLHAVTGNVVRSETLMVEGYHSATAVARAREPDLVAMGLTVSDAREALNQARDIANKAAHLWFDVHTLFRDTKTTPFRPSPAANDFFSKLPGYAELFGEQSFCRCEHCQSVLSPAAYFVDLMRYIERNILAVSFIGNEKHPLHLKIRRPDLWTLPLTCDNTNKYIPYLDVINEVLETFIQSQKPGDFYRDLSKADNSLSQPFHWPMERLTTYLQHFKTSRFEIAKRMHAGPDGQVRARLGLSFKEYEIITSSRVGNLNADAAYFEKLFRVTQVPRNSADAALDRQNLQDLLQATDLSRDVCASVLTSLFVNAVGSANAKIKIIAGVSNPAQNAQNDIELVEQLSLRRLDRINRFIRLWRKLPWTVTELDAVLEAFRVSGFAMDIDPAALRGIVEILAVKDTVKLDVEETLAMAGKLPTKPIREKVSLFDQRFNSESFAADGPWPAPGVRYVHAALNTANTGVSLPDARATHRLLSALQVSDRDLVDFIGELITPLFGAPTTPPSTANSFDLSLENLSLLYRHARAARTLGVSAKDLFSLIRLTPEIVAPSNSDTVKRIRSVSDLLAIARFQQWQKSSGFGLEEIAYLIGGPIIIGDITPEILASDLQAAIAAEKSLEFVDTVFTQVGLSEQQSRTLVLDNSAPAVGNAAFEPSVTAGTHRLTAVFDPTDPVAVGSLVVSILNVREKIGQSLQGYGAWTVLKARLSAKLALSPEKMDELLALLRSGMSATDVAGVVRAIQGGAPVVPLEMFLGNVLRYARLLKSAIFTPQTLKYLATQKQTFALRSSLWTSAAELNGSLSVQSIERIATYVRLANAPDRSFTGASAEPDIPALHASIDAITSGQPPAKPDQIAAALRVDIARVIPLLSNLPTLPLNALERLAAIRAILDLIGDLGLNGETLRLVASDDYDDLSRAADGVLAAFRVKYSDEKTFLEKLEPFEDKLRGRKRDGLIDYMTTEWRVPFASPSSLYQYFLLDVELEGCARTSRIVAANSSLQLYVQRVLMNLERSEDGKVTASFGDVAQESVRGHIAEWTWRKHYRVWEANRKVFLYPENYIEPELRDDKSHIFKELEDTLLQQQIGEQSILDAYAKYLAGFEELANLTIAGVHLEYRSTNSRLHVFAASSSDPPTFYYRVVDALDSERPIFGNWSKVNVQIPVKKVSLVVYLGRLYVFWVTITTRSETGFEGGDSKFIGYIHKISVFYSVLRLDDSWTAPQRLLIRYGDSGKTAAAVDSAVTVPDPNKDVGDDKTIALIPWLPWITIDVPTPKSFTPRYDKVPHANPIEGYTLRGDQWQIVYPSVNDDNELILTMRNFRMTGVLDVGLNLYTVVPGSHTDITRGLLLNSKGVTEEFIGGNLSTLTSDFAARSLPLMSPATQLDVKEKDKGAPEEFRIASSSDEAESDPDRHLLFSVAESSDVRLLAASGIVNDAVSCFKMRDAYLIHQLFGQDGALYRLHRLSTTVSNSLRSTLGNGGISGLLSLVTQIELHETPWAIPPSATLLLGDKFHPLGNRDPFIGAYGSYMAEIFFQVPFLIANHLNSQQKFAAAQRWYHYMFDPTATDNPSRFVFDSADNLIEWFPYITDRPWRYLGFRNLTSLGLRGMLRDEKALAAYRNDPFNPHAIARLRPSAYQKSIVMKYIDNLLDWGDQLFAQFTMESVTEASMLYVMASDILGPRAAELGDCLENSGTRTYEQIAPQLEDPDEFLIELEALAVPLPIKRPDIDYVIKPVDRRGAKATLGQFLSVAGTASSQAATAPSAAGGGAALVEMNWNKPSGGYWSSTAGTPLSDIHGAELSGSAMIGTGAIKTLHSSLSGSTNGTHSRDARILDQLPPLDVRHQDLGKPPDTWQPSELVPSKLLFCIPDNKELRAYWDRVEDRLFKIRNCMDIAGVRRRLELFSPEIDPRLLVRLKAAGLSVEDVLATTSGDVPPYRFAYLIEKAKQYAATVQGFGSQLINALEKRDAEELNQLRIVHEQNLLKQRREAMEWEVNAADDTLESLKRQKIITEYRRTHYLDLSQKGLSQSEQVQQVSQHFATGLKEAESIVHLQAAISYLIPQLGSPFAMKYGGQELGDSGVAFAQWTSSMASILDTVSRSAGLEATFERRDEEWKHQAEMARRDVDQIQKQISAAEFRQQIAKRSLETHQKMIDQAEEVFNLYRDRFSNLGRFTWLSTQLHRLYRMAFNTAFSMAKLAEQACLFERDEEGSSPILGGNYWNNENAGLLTGEQLLLDLQRMERRFIETNYRKLEITQSFSVAQFAPDKLLDLRANGTCTFTVPEVFFDLYYPGHYKRAIKAVRLTIPCIVGPYTNVGATLRLKSCKIRKEAKTIASVTTVPLRHTVSVAISSAQNDAGVFEFGFRDERYMPFEGAGAIDSEWEITLPNQYRSFDYSTISDVILHISYTATEDAGFRPEVDVQNGQLMTMLRALPPKRLFNIRSEFPTAWAKFKNQQPSNTSLAELKFEIVPQHYPFWSHGKLNSIAKAELYAKTTLASLVVAGKSDGSGTQDAITEREGTLLKGELINGKPQSPTGSLTLYLDDKSIEDLWLLIVWSE